MPIAIAAPATVDVSLDDAGVLAAALEVRLDGHPLASAEGCGATRLQIAAGSHVLPLQRDGEAVLGVPVGLVGDEQLQLSAAPYAGRAPVYHLASSASGETTVDLAEQRSARVDGAVTSADGEPVVGAAVRIGERAATTDDYGHLAQQVRPGTASVAVTAGRQATTALPAQAFPYGSNPALAIRLAALGATEGSATVSTLSGVEVSAVVKQEEGGQYEAMVERRESAQITETLSAEQIARAGDTDAASALKRVTGLSLVEDRFVYVRGMGERYSAALVNGAQVPSPDPTRRVIPLDLFPADMLARITVQKTYSADMPAEFGGGTVLLQTRGAPEAFLLRASAGLGYADGTTGQRGLRYAGGGRDWTGADDGTRDAPAGLLGDAFPTDNSALETLSERVAARSFDVHEQSVGPDASTAFAIGDRFVLDEHNMRFGYLAAFRHSQSWDSRLEQRNGYSALASGELAPLLDFERRRTERAIDSGLFFAGNLAIGDAHELTATLFRVRQTTDEARIDEGLLASGSIERQFQLEWIENALSTRQIGGTHRLDTLVGATVNWQYTDSTASRQSPNTREFSFAYDDTDKAFYYNGQNFIRFDQLDDEAREGRIDLRVPWQLNDTLSGSISAGFARLERDRVSSIERFSYRGGRPANLTDIDDVLSPENIFIGPGGTGLRLQRSTQPTDAYTATQTLDALYLSTDVAWGDWRANLGVREERNDQRVVTQPLFVTGTVQPVIADRSATDHLPAGSLTWAYSDSAQWRIGYSRTLARPDFRELSEAPYIDPLLDIRVQGNPNLQQAEIESRELRWEYYFSPSESFSIGYFEKDFRNPIELVRLPASGELLGIRNAAAASNRGVELDITTSLGWLADGEGLPGWLKEALPWYDLYVGANYARIDSEIDLGASQGTQTNARRPLQGQSPYVGNVSLTWMHPEGRYEATLLYNVFGARISQVGDSGLPDIYERPFKQLDVTLAGELPWDGWKLKLKLRNLLDPEARFTVGDALTRRYRKGREIGLSVEWRY